MLATILGPDDWETTWFRGWRCLDWNSRTLYNFVSTMDLLSSLWILSSSFFYLLLKDWKMSSNGLSFFDLFFTSLQSSTAKEKIQLKSLCNIEWGWCAITYCSVFVFRWKLNLKAPLMKRDKQLLSLDACPAFFDLINVQMFLVSSLDCHARFLEHG